MRINLNSGFRDVSALASPGLSLPDFDPAVSNETGEW
jgi:hypothetical protein